MEVPEVTREYDGRYPFVSWNPPVKLNTELEYTMFASPHITDVDDPVAVRMRPCAAFVMDAPPPPPPENKVPFE